MKIIIAIIGLLSISLTAFSAPKAPNERLIEDMKIYQKWIDLGIIKPILPTPSEFDQVLECDSKSIRFESEDPNAFIGIDNDPENDFIANARLRLESGTHTINLFENGRVFSFDLRIDGLDASRNKEFNYCRIVFPKSK